ncbi:uncharacterized protein LOC128863530 [Anastrepha ludens]|uniref:uncharacterized protein LOC128863530 n=1 Tax=Anastrepha ludens TaxID=28586 RepID=UPI0023AF6188|nr:uncharacterized protein LOC128863530 [Anastrepha ludens]XP_053958713.1 uncharacterized protein LOC128863530 [Anastrepha ludens]
MDETSGSKRKRKRINPTHVWTDLQTQVLLQAVCDAVKDQPETFEKPTSEAFYNKIKESTLCLESIGWMSLKCKMRHLKVKYLDAVDWKEKNVGSQLLTSGKEQSVMEYINKISPYWDILSDIFRHSKIVSPGIVYEGANDDIDTTNAEVRNMCDSNPYDSGDGELELKFQPGTPQPSTSQSSYDLSHTKGQQKSLHTQTSRQSPIDITSTKNIKHRHIKKKSACAHKFQCLRLIEKKKIALEKEKLEFEKEKLQNEFELRKIELQNEFELKKFEIGTRIESDERVKKYEIDLKYK